jgi:hypothetical protein
LRTKAPKLSREEMAFQKEDVILSRLPLSDYGLRSNETSFCGGSAPPDPGQQQRRRNKIARALALQLAPAKFIGRAALQRHTLSP